jgi:hypothetical protein
MSNIFKNEEENEEEQKISDQFLEEQRLLVV